MNRPRKSCRWARVPAFAKINLGLRVLGRRADGYHELRTVFQTISLADRLEIAFAPGRTTRIELVDEAGIPGNLAARAARLAMEALPAAGCVGIRLEKRIPVGAGLGGGSSDAAAVLLALPALVGTPLEFGALAGIARTLGSDVPFFLAGGTALGIGRGEELFPLPDARAGRGVLILPGVRVGTPWAYAALSARLTTESQQNKIVSFQEEIWDPSARCRPVNDFETVVFERHSRLARLKRELLRAGASVALLSGSGAAVFGLFADAAGASGALARLARRSALREEERALEISLVSRARYRSAWRRALKEYILPDSWPPQPRTSR